MSDFICCICHDLNNFHLGLITVNCWCLAYFCWCSGNILHTHFIYIYFFFCIIMFAVFLLLFTWYCLVPGYKLYLLVHSFVVVSWFLTLRLVLLSQICKLEGIVIFLMTSLGCSFLQTVYEFVSSSFSNVKNNLTSILGECRIPSVSRAFKTITIGASWVADIFLI